MAGHKVTVVGVSAGGVEALQTLVGGFSLDLPATIFVVMHLSPDRRSVVPAILSTAGAPLAVLAVDGEAMQQGCAYFAPSDHHLVLGHVTCHAEA
jgi:two-component system, chemotaxis family, protein-glutamate methylesterase/glutaminase